MSQAGYENIELRQLPDSLTIVLSRPAVRNAISDAMLEEITDVLSRARSDPAVRGIVVTGAIDYFSSGADLARSSQVGEHWERLQYLKRRHAFCAMLESLDKPVIAAIEGYCLTAAFEIALACDLRIAGAGASFAITSSRIGTVAGLGATQRLPRLAGIGPALDVLLSARRVSAGEALQLGLINRVVDKGCALASAQDMISQLPGRPAGEWASLKRQYRYGTF